MADKVFLKKDGSIGRIVLNDPEHLNALCLDMAKQFPRIVKEIRADRELRCVILTGAGRAFSAGGNLNMILEKRDKSLKLNKKEMVPFYKSFLSIREIEIPTIAYINGPAVGAGLCVALACDIRIASEKATLGANFTRLGLSPGLGGSQLISQLGGLTVAAELIFTGRTIEAAEAHSLGLVNQVHPANEAEQVVNELAEMIAANAPVAIRETKRLLYQNASLSFDDALANEAEGQAVCFQTEDLIEGINAIREKRKPSFSGR